MNIQFIQFIDGDFKPIDKDIDVKDWHSTPTWIRIKSNDRNEVYNYFKSKNVFIDAEEHITKPSIDSTTKKLENGILENIVISSVDNIYTTDYVTIIIDRDLSITISPETTTLFNYETIIENQLKSFKNLNEILFYLLTANILTKNTKNATIARNRIRKLEDMLVKSPEEIESFDLISCSRDIGRLSDIIEDQSLGFGIISTISKQRNKSQVNFQYNDLLTNFEALNKSMQRLEDKTETLRLQYLLFQQEKSNRKINVLTIVQAIFVPLTFLAGIYGMNFENIPGLNNPNGYFILWGVFGLITVSLLAYFYKNGWFE